MSLRKVMLTGLVVFFVASMAMAATEQKVEMVKCPVSGHEMKKADAKISAEYKAKTFYFCSEQCKTAFTKEPEKYVKTIFTCPMHSEIQMENPGKCPKCGMNLEIRLVQKNVEEKPAAKKDMHQMPGKSCCGGN